MTDRRARVLVGLLASSAGWLLVACATQADLRSASRDLLDRNEELRSSLEAKIDQINKTQRQAEQQQAELKRLLDETKNELKETRQRGAELETTLREIKSQDLSGVFGQLEVHRRDIEGLQSRLDDQKAQVYSLDRKTATQSTRLQEVLTTVEKKLSDRLDAQDKRLGVYEKRAEATDRSVAQVAETVRTIGAKLSSQVDQHSVSLSKLEETTKQTDIQVRALSRQVSEFKGTLTEFTRVLQMLGDRSTELDRRVTELAGKTEGKVGVLVVQQGEQATKLEALSKRLEVEGQAMAVHMNEVTRNVSALGQSVQTLQGQIKDAAARSSGVPELSAQAEQQAARLEALEKTVAAAVATVNESSRGLGELKRVMEESLGKQAVGAEVPQAIVPAGPGSAAQDPSSGASRTAPVPTLSDKEAYDRAYQNYAQGRYDEALTSFGSFLVEYPDSALVPNAHFWMAECYVRARDYGRGLEQYEHVLKKYPKSAKAATALYRKAMAFLELNNKEAAKSALRQLIATYPKSEDSQRAKAKLASLK